MLSWEKIKGWFQRAPLTPEAERVLSNSQNPRELLQGLDELITRNEMAVRGIHREIEALEAIERTEQERVRSGALPDRSQKNVLRRIQRLRTQMDGLEERLQIYNRNIRLQVQLIGRVQALDAMQLRGVDEETIEHILSAYEEHLDEYQEILGLEDETDTEAGAIWDDSASLAALEAEILGAAAPTADRSEVARNDRRDAATVVKPSPRRNQRNDDRHSDLRSEPRTERRSDASAEVEFANEEPAPVGSATTEGGES